MNSNVCSTCLPAHTQALPRGPPSKSCWTILASALAASGCGHGCLEPPWPWLYPGRSHPAERPPECPGGWVPGPVAPGRSHLSLFVAPLRGPAWAQRVEFLGVRKLPAPTASGSSRNDGLSPTSWPQPRGGKSKIMTQRIRRYAPESRNNNIWNRYMEAENQKLLYFEEHHQDSGKAAQGRGGDICKPHTW